MKKIIHLFATLSLLGISTFTACGKSESEVTIYPAPGDLSGVQGLEESGVFDLSVSGKDAFVYRGWEIRDEFEWYGDAGVMVDSPSYNGVSFCAFETTGKCEIRITTTEVIEHWDLKPTVEGAKKLDDHTIVATIDGPQKLFLSVDLEGNEEHDYFIISAESAMDYKVSKKDPSVLYLKKGVHHFGQAWDPFVEGVKTVYLEPGAVVEATIRSKGKQNISILGRGVFAQSFVRHAEEVENRQEQEWDADWTGICLTDSQNIVMEGVWIANSPGYQCEFSNCVNVLTRNVKLTGFGEHNNDGYHLYGKNITVEDGFVAGNDDRICVTGLYDADNGDGNLEWDGVIQLIGVPAENITIRNMVFAGLHNNGGDIMLTWNGADYCRNVIIEDCKSLFATNKGFLASKHGGSAIFDQILIQNIHLYHPVLVSLEVADGRYMGAGGGAIHNFTLKDITIDAEPSEVGLFMNGQNETSDISGFHFINLKANGKKITDLSQTAIEINEFVSDITFE